MKKLIKIIYVLFAIMILNSTAFALLLPKNRVYEVILDENKSFSHTDNSENPEDDIILKNVEVNDIVKFGRFYNLDSNGEVKKSEIEWKVLDKLGDYVLLISKDIIKTMPYNDTWNPITWKNSSIRSWLNNDFYDIAFTEIEKKQISTVITKNTGNSSFNVTEEYDTRDNVFLLSIEEVKKYFGKHNSLIAVGTAYAKHEGLWLSTYGTSYGYSVWWLRSPGKSTSYAAIIHAAGSLGESGDGVATKGNGVRPCVWVKTK